MCWGFNFILFSFIILLMEQLITYIALIIFGLCLGSFAGAMVWRLRARQLEFDKKEGEKVNKKEYDRLHRLTKAKLINDHSCCLDCGYRLKWYDLIPIFSWLFLRGKCRKCHKKIGYMEPSIELGTAAYFVLSYICLSGSLLDGLSIVKFILWLLAGVVFAIIFVYDLKWYIIPNQASFALIGIGILSALLTFVQSYDKFNSLVNIFSAVLLLSGLYLAIYFLSRRQWIGFGDIKLCLGMALLLANWQLAFVALFAANLTGCLIVLPGLLTGKLKRTSHIPFGPLLIAGFVIAGLLGNYIVSWYVSLLV